MRKVMRLSLSLLIPVALAFLVSCGENMALVEETLYFDAGNAGWLSQDTMGVNFVMSDNNGITQSFTMDSEEHYFGKSWTSTLGITTHMTHTEYRYQAWHSSYGYSLSQSLRAGFEPYGDRLYVDLHGTTFAFDLKTATLSEVSCSAGRISLTMTDIGYEAWDEEILSTIELMESYATASTVYDSVLHFSLKDFEGERDDFDVTTIYLAKHAGLIRFELENGVVYERK